MVNRIKDKPLLNQRVTGLALGMGIGTQGHPPVAVSIGTGENKSARIYDHVVSTLPFGCFRMLDTTQCRLPWDVKEATQSLQYGSSVKVGMLFKSRWWEVRDQNHKGGVSKTDRPVRMIIYPSYGIDNEGATMIVSYSWTQDAGRLGAFVKEKGSPADQQLKATVLRDLAAVHGLSVEFLEDQCIDHHAWNWDDSEFSAGNIML
jgi:monoamine oxidase